MIQQEITLYEEPVVVVLPAVPTQTYQNYTNTTKTFSQWEVDKAISQANENNLFLGTTFHYANNPVQFYIKRFETRPAYVDDIAGNPAIIIAGKAGDPMEIPFSIQEILTLQGK